MTHKVSKISDSESEYEYRGIRFERTDVARGYWGHYATLSSLGKVKERAGTRRDLLAKIDFHLDRNKPIDSLVGIEADEIQVTEDAPTF